MLCATVRFNNNGSCASRIHLSALTSSSSLSMSSSLSRISRVSRIALALSHYLLSLDMRSGSRGGKVTRTVWLIVAVLSLHLQYRVLISQQRSLTGMSRCIAVRSRVSTPSNRIDLVIIHTVYNDVQQFATLHDSVQLLFLENEERRSRSLRGNSYRCEIST